jgi:hypothetical protein
MIYVYALTDRGDPPRGVDGLGGARLLALTVQPVTAVYSDLDGKAPEPEPEHLWRHEHVAEALLGERAVLPVRFGTVLDGTGRLRTLLERNREVIAAALERVRGLVEVGVRVLPAAGEPAASDNGVPGPAASGREYLMRRLARERRERAAREQAARCADAIHEPLAALARDTDRRAPRRRELLAAAYLLAPSAVDALVTRARELDAAHPELRIVCTGPWPAHSFAPELDLEGAAHG